MTAPLWTRGVGLIIAALTVLMIVRGITTPSFVWPDIAAIAILFLGVVLPGRLWGAPILLIGLAFAAGIFSVSVSQSFEAGEPNYRTFAGIIGCFVAMVGIAVSGRAKV